MLTSSGVAEQDDGLTGVHVPAGGEVQVPPAAVIAAWNPPIPAKRSAYAKVMCGSLPLWRSTIRETGRCRSR